ncbi:mechanosensitive ion channel [Tamlana fucoidanivorans]|uniref:Mechanosensitive ion channel n=1 Tax=Allotamlana fucoidanivorans TaxID=2583814 RepID=A0A5C4SH97_9FLAO|nr:mechanosensitive ion channel domain-containing protein [Tamlana fucoidanivorans]TNJ42893.1 mechanosensitive ion channel [Tamlana fucoidanivorans]
MEKITAWNDGVITSLSAMTGEVAKVIPNILGAIVVLVLGWLLTKVIVSIVKKALKLAKADKLDDKINDIELFGSKKLNFNVITIITNFVKWIFYFIILIVVTDILNLTLVSEEIKNFLGYVPRLFSALIIFTVGLLLANFIKKAVVAFFESMDLSGARLISQIVFLLLIIFISITALNQAGVDTAIITSNITLLLAGFLLAFALAFGLGAQRVITELLKAFYARKTYEIGQYIEFNDIRGEVLSINHISVTLKTKEGKLIVPISDIVESQVSVRD